MRVSSLTGLIFIALLASARPVAACAPPPPLLHQPPAVILAVLHKDSAPLLSAMDTYSVGLEACYDSPLGPLELAPLVKQAAAVADNMAALRRLAEQQVRTDEPAFEDLLSSDLWGDIESLRVASAYSAAWGKLSAAVRHISADDKRRALIDARQAMQVLTFEFKHPVLVQRSMYGLATTQIEGGQLSAALATLQRLQSSLKRGGDVTFKNAVDEFYARVSAPDYRPPTPLFDAPTKAPSAAALQASGAGRPHINNAPAHNMLALARQALREARPASEITDLIRPALRGDVETVKAALDLLARDQLLLDAMDYEPGQSLRVMRRAFATGQYGQIKEAWVGVKPFYPYLPVGLKRQVDYQLGVALLNHSELDRAIQHLRAARQTLNEGTLNEGTQAARVDKLIALAQLSYDRKPDEATLNLARGFENIALPPTPPPPLSPTPPPGTLAGTHKTDAPSALDVLLLHRARVVLARHAAGQKDWAAADAYLSGIGPQWPGYQLFLGMRVRLIGEAVKARAAAHDDADAVNKTARGGMTLYRLWQSSDCPPGCLSGNRQAVHRAAIELALAGALASSDFGIAWGSFVAEGGDVRPLMPRALAYLTGQADAARLVILLEPADESEAAFVLGHWKAHLRKLRQDGDAHRHYGWLAEGLEDLQGRPRAVLLEALIDYELVRDEAMAALAHAEKLARDFPRRPSAWFLRAAALTANRRDLEAARALAALAQRTPADDPVGMGARLGLAALFIGLERAEQACAMRAKIFSRPQAEAHWQQALEAFPILADWQKTTDAACTNATG